MKMKKLIALALALFLVLLFQPTCWLIEIGIFD
ncbi:UNVERIFIED_ORG: hypothetical protein ABID75_005717 [Bacillus proteolyticus]